MQTGMQGTVQPFISGILEFSVPGPYKERSEDSMADGRPCPESAQKRRNFPTGKMNQLPALSNEILSHFTRS